MKVFLWIVYFFRKYILIAVKVCSWLPYSIVLWRIHTRYFNTFKRVRHIRLNKARSSSFSWMNKAFKFRNNRMRWGPGNTTSAFSGWSCKYVGNVERQFTTASKAKLLNYLSPKKYYYTQYTFINKCNI